VIEFFNSYIELTTLYRHSIIMGHFNADLHSASYDAGQIKSFINLMNFFLVPYSRLITHARPLLSWIYASLMMVNLFPTINMRFVFSLS